MLSSTLLRRVLKCVTIAVPLFFIVKLGEQRSDLIGAAQIQNRLLENNQLIKLEEGWKISFHNCQIEACRRYENFELESFTATHTAPILKEILADLQKNKIDEFPYIFVRRSLTADEIKLIQDRKSVYLVAPLIRDAEVAIGKESYSNESMSITHQVSVENMLQGNPHLAMLISAHANNRYFGPSRWPFALALNSDSATEYTGLAKGELTVNNISDDTMWRTVFLLAAVFLIMSNVQILGAFISHLFSQAAYVAALYFMVNIQTTETSLLVSVLMRDIVIVAALLSSLTLIWFIAVFSGMARATFPPFKPVFFSILTTMTGLHLFLDPPDILSMFRHGILLLNTVSCVVGLVLLIKGVSQYKRKKEKIETRIAIEKVDRSVFVLSAFIIGFGLLLEGHAALETFISGIRGVDKDINTSLHSMSISLFFVAVSLCIGSLKEMITRFANKQTELIRTQLDFHHFEGVMLDKTMALEADLHQERDCIKFLIIVTLYFIKREISAFGFAQFKLSLPADFLKPKEVDQSYLTRIPSESEELEQILRAPEKMSHLIDRFVIPFDAYDDMEVSDWIQVYSQAKEHYTKYFKSANDNKNAETQRMKLEKDQQVFVLEERGLKFGMIHVDNINLQNVLDQLSQPELDFLRSLLTNLNSAIYKHIQAGHNKRSVSKTKLAAAGIYDITQIPYAETKEDHYSIMSVDIRNFTAISEAIREIPNGVHEFRKLYSRTIANIYDPAYGWLESWVGDGAWYVFTNPDEAVRTAFRLVDQMSIFNDSLRNNKNLSVELVNKLVQVVDTVAVGIAAHYGPVSLGDAGDDNQYNFTILSDTVNTTARIESLTKDIPNSLVISKDLLDQLSPEFKDSLKIVPLGDWEFKGKNKLISCYRVEKHALGVSGIAS